MSDAAPANSLLRRPADTPRAACVYLINFLLMSKSQVSVHRPVVGFPGYKGLPASVLDRSGGSGRQRAGWSSAAAWRCRWQLRL